MQVALSSIDVLDVVQDPTLDSQKSRAMWMVGVGTGGPAVVAGSMMLLYRIAMALFVGFGPFFHSMSTIRADQITIPTLAVLWDRYSGAASRPGPQGQPPGSYCYVPPQPSDGGREDRSINSVNSGVTNPAIRDQQ